MCDMHANIDIAPRIFVLPKSDQVLVIETSVIQTFLRFRQTDDKPEGGGLLFGEFYLPKISVVEASGPNRLDRRARALFIPNRPAQQHKIQGQFKKGRHFIGEWHTHPEAHPTPSRMDMDSMADSFVKSRHELNYFIMIIVGNGLTRLSLCVSAHDGKQSYILNEAE